MRVIQGFRFELNPNREQHKRLAQHVGAARYAYNWGLARCREALERGERIPSAIDLHKEWNVYKREHAPWWTEVSKCAPQEALRDLERAFRNWRAKRAGFPRFKRKKSIADNKARFTGSVWVTPRHVQLPRIGRVRTKERTDRLLTLFGREKIKVKSATVSREADRWFVSLIIEVERDPPPTLGPEATVVGVDMGLETYATLHDGEAVEAIAIPEAIKAQLTRLEKRIRREQRRLSRKQWQEEPDPHRPGKTRRKLSKNGLRNLIRLQRLHRRRRNILNDFLHKATTALAKAKRVYVVEDLSIKGMLRRRRRGYKLSRAISESAWGEFVRQLKYKAEWYGSRVIEAPKHYPSSRICSACGAIREDLSLSDRIFHCPRCGLEIHRDVNAAINLRQYGLAALKGPTGSSPGSHTCGDPSGGGTDHKIRSTSHGSPKQEG